MRRRLTRALICLPIAAVLGLAACGSDSEPNPTVPVLGVTVPDITAPNVTAPDITAPNITAPDISTPGSLDIPDISTGG